MVPLVPTITASFGSSAVIEQVQTANRCPENFSVTTIASSTPGNVQEDRPLKPGNNQDLVQTSQTGE